MKLPSRRRTATVAGLLAAVLACGPQSSGPAAPATPALSIASPSADVTATNGVVHVEVRVDGAQSVQLLVDGAPLASVRAPFQYEWDTSALPEASYELRAELVSGGRAYESAPKTIVVDRTKPQPPGIAPLVCAASTTSIALTGTAEANATVTLYEGSAALEAVPASAAGSWRLDLDLGTGSHTLLATARDAAGNTSDASTRIVTVDGSLSPVPEPPTLTRALPALTNFVSLWMQGVAQFGNYVYLYWDERQATRDGSPGYLEVAARDGTWGTFVDVPEGTHVFTATQRTLAGCESRPTAPQTVVGDFTHPGAPQILSGVPPIVNRAGPASFPVNGSAEAKSTVRVYLGATWVEARASDAGEWAVTVQTSDLPEGSDVLEATAQDAAGNTSPEASTAAILVDRIPPAAPKDLQGAPGIVNANGPATFTLRGAAEALSTVRLSQGSTSLGSTQASAAGAWSISVTTSALAEGTCSLIATATDAAGNDSSAATTASILVDRTVAPPVWVTVPATPIKINAPFQVRGTAEANSTVSVYEIVGTTRTLLTQTTASGGSWNVDLTMTSVGAHTLTTTATDVAGNLSADSVSATVNATQ